MPSIRKIRIVNFRYDYGTRLIPDQIFCTEDSNGTPLNTLFELNNGCGKTVIVQLMLQPVCPKAKVQSRNICDFFQKGTDHAFVLLEWALDNDSPNSLLTGIAISASTITDEETPKKNIRFYTFLHDYLPGEDKLDLVHFPLSERNGNIFRAKSFEEVRKFLQTKKIEYFSSDSLSKYHKRLEEYGILHTEWEKILTRINSFEGGILSFFEEHTTSDRLIDHFIIPEVMPDERASAEQLERMFLNYAKTYSSQGARLRQRTQISEFIPRLEGILPLITDMWNAKDLRIQNIRSLSDMIFTLQQHIDDTEKMLMRAEETIDVQTNKLNRIKAEKESERFYKTQDENNSVITELSQAKDEEEKAKTSRDSYARKIKVLDAAKEYADLKAYREEEKSLLTRLEELEHGDYDAHVKDLKYSLLLSAKEAENADKAELQNQNDLLRRHKDKLSALESVLTKDKQSFDNQNAACNEKNGSRKTLKSQIESGLKELGVHIQLMMGEMYYDPNEKEAVSGSLNALAAEAENVLTEFSDEDTSLDEETDKLNEKRNRLYEERAETNADMQRLRSKLSEYEKAYNKAALVLKHLSIPEENIFTDEPLIRLDREVTSLKDSLSKTRRSAKMLSEQIRCIENGQLHLSKTAVDFLTENGVTFQTGEKYLFELDNSENMQAILKSNPLMAYSVVVYSEKDKEKLLSAADDAAWLSSVVPVYTIGEVADMAEGKWEKSKAFLSAYDKEYFSDVSAYKENVKGKYGNAKSEAEHTQSLIDGWEKERSDLTAFTYSADYEPTLKTKIESYRNKLSDIEKTISEIDKRREEITARKSELKGLIKEQQKRLNAANRRIENFEKTSETITQYEKLSEEILQYENIIEELKKKIRKSESDKAQMCELITECKNKIEMLNEHLSEYRSLTEELENSPKTENVLENTYDELLTEYNTYKKSRSSDINEIQNQIDKLNRKIKDTEDGIGRFGLTEEEYCSEEYSVAAYLNAVERQGEANEKISILEKQVNTLSTKQGRLETVLNQITDSLKKLNSELLDRSEIGLQQERRQKECETELERARTESEEYKKALRKFKADKEYAENRSERYRKEMTGYMPKLLGNICNTDTILDKIEKNGDNLRRAEKASSDYLERELKPFRDEDRLFADTIDGISEVIGNEQGEGDKYYTLHERTEENIRLYRDKIKELDIQLNDVEVSKKQLVKNCLQRVSGLYGNLNAFSNKSKVQIGNSKKQMINIVLPEVDTESDIPSQRIERYITSCVEDYLSNRSSIKNSRREHLELRRLLNCYIGQETISVKVYKVNENSQNNRYIPWEAVFSENSGSQQFVVFFSLIASAINYTRSMSNNLSKSSGVLILDNPFGSSSADYILDPMFNIAKLFHIQLICFTHIGSDDVLRNFNLVYQLKFRQLALSNTSVLELKSMQEMEHAFYLSEQLSMF